MSSCDRGLHFSRFEYSGLHIGPRKRIQDSLGFLDPTLWIPDFRFFVSKTWILDFSHSRDSGFRQLYSESQSSGSRIPQAKISWIPKLSAWREAGKRRKWPWAWLRARERRLTLDACARALGARVAQLVSAWPWVRDVPSTIPGVNTSLF